MEKRGLGQPPGTPRELGMFELRKIGIVKRASAWLLDAILLAVLATGFMFIISLISNFNHQQELANRYSEEWENFRVEYMEAISDYYGFVYRDDGDGYTVEKNGVQSSLNAVMELFAQSEGEFDYSKISAQKTAEAYEVYLTLTPGEKANAQYNLVYSLLFMMLAIGILLARMILEFVIPIIFKNGQTVGKKVFGIGLVRVDCVRVNTLALFARTVLGKFTIETMFPLLMIFMIFFGGVVLLGIILLVAFLLMNIILFFATRNRTPIHDLLAGTVAVDIKLQMIYQSEDELIEKKALAARESAENARS